MATVIEPDNKTPESNNPGQENYKRLVHETPAEQLERIPTMDDQQAEDFYKNRQENAPDNAEASEQSDLQNQTAQTAQPAHENQVGRGYRSSSTTGALKNPRWFVINRTRALLGGGIIGLIVALLIFFISSGPLQLVQLSKVLQNPSAKQTSDSSKRLNRLMRASRAKDPGETRVGKLGSDIFGRTISQLKDIGVEIERNPISGSPTKTTIETDKLKTAYPELEGMSDKNTISWLSDKLNIPVDAFSGSGGTFTINSSEFDITTARLLTNNTVGLLDNGKIVTGIKARVMTKFFNLPSLFHPIQRAIADKYNKLSGKALQAAEQQDEQTRKENLTTAPETEGKGAFDKVTSDTTDPKAMAVAAVNAVGGACVVYNDAGEIVKINRDLIVLPSAIRAVDLMALGAQVMAGRDLTSAQVGQAERDLVGKNGKTIWQGTAMYALAHKGQKVSSFRDIPPDYRNAFGDQTTFSTIRNWAGDAVHSVIPLVPASATCSAPGQAAATLLQLGVSAIAELGSGGLLTPVVVGTWVAKNGVSLAVTAVAMHFIESLVINGNTAKLPANAFSGPIGGDLLAYGARESANISSIASGGISLGNNASTLLADNQQEFASHSLVYKLFNPSDYRTVAGQIIDNNGSATNDLSNIASTFTHFGSIFSSISSIFTPHAQADTQYDWGFPQYGIPDSIMNDPNMDDPYANADYVAKNLLDPNCLNPDGATNSSCSYIDRAKKCFGVDITKTSDGVWDVVPGSGLQSAVDPNGEDYQSANCSDNNEDWHREIMFVFDTPTMKAATCFAGDQSDADTQQSCSDLGEGQTSSASNPTTPPGVSIDMAHLYDKSTDVACAPNTKDLGIQQGYTNGNEVDIRICAISNLPSSGEESNGGYGVTGADGKCVLNSRVSGAVYAMVQAAKQAGVNLAANSCFRTMAHQQALCPCDGVHVAFPGHSNHQMGLAIDFSTLPFSPGPVPGNPVWDWLSKNASNFGYKNYPAEAWHWSPTGN